jgi:trk system potassium uptake protein TrkA
MFNRTEGTEQEPAITVIMGCGRLGASIAHSLLNEGHRVFIIDTQRSNFNRLRLEPIESGAITPLIGDGTLYADLLRTPIQDAQVFIAVSGRDTQNALAAQIAKHIFEVPNVICRMNDPEGQAMFIELGLNAISDIKPFTDLVVSAAKK